MANAIKNFHFDYLNTSLTSNSTTEDNIIAHKVQVQQNSFRGRSRLIIVGFEDSEGVM